MKKLLLITFSLLCMVLNASAETWSGTCGANLTWSLNSEDSTFTIAGTGAMYDYAETNLPPWYRQRAYIKHVVFPSGITTLGACSFYQCSALKAAVTIPDEVTKVGAECFCYTRIVGVSISSSVTGVGYDAFLSPVLQYIAVDASNTSFSSQDGVLFNKDKTRLVCYPAGKNDVSEYTIPSTVKFIVGDALRRCMLVSVTLPAAVTSIGSGAFLSTTLQNINVHPDNTTFCSVDGVLFSKDKTVIHTYPSGKKASAYVIPNTVVTIGGRCFVDVPALQSIDIPSSVVTIEEHAFWNMPKLRRLYIPASVKSLAAYFTSASMLQGITVDSRNAYFASLNGVLYDKAMTTLIAYPRDSAATIFTVPSSVTNVGNSAFAYADKLKRINLPSNLETISLRAFQNCKNLVSINIPASVTSIGSTAFSGCTKLLDIIMNTPTPPTVGTDVFYDSYDKALAVPCGATAAYQASSIFGQFKNIIEQCYYDVTVTSANAAQGSATGSVSNVLGGSVIEISATPVAGYVFQKWSDGNTDNPRDYLVEETATVTAYFTKGTYTLTTKANPTAGGTVTAGGNVVYGATKALTATPAAGYKFTGWTVSGAGSKLSSTTTATTTFTMGTANATVTANFAKESYSLTTSANPTAGGTVTAGGTIQYGATKSLTATPATGYKFTGWTVSGTGAKLSSTTAATTTFTMGTANATVTAVFVKASYTLTTTVSPTAGGTVTAGGNVVYGATKSLTATPAAGYKFTGWTVSGTGAKLSSTATATTTFTMGTANATVTANFAKESYSLTTSANPTAGGTVTAGGTIQYGSSKTLTATAKPDYKFSAWVLTGANASLSTSLDATTTFTMGTENATVSAVFTYLGHDYGTPTYTWSADHSRCTAKRVCKRDATHIETETVTAGVVVTKPTCGVAGKTTYTAVFTNTAFAKQTAEEAIPALEPTTATISVSAYGKVTVNGIDYATSGTYSQTLTNAAGCDSVLTINATVYNAEDVDLEVVEYFTTCEYRDAVKVTCNTPGVSFKWMLNGVNDASQTGDTYLIPTTAPKEGSITVIATIEALEIRKNLRYEIYKEITTKMWDDVISVINPKQDFVNFEWYHNDQMVGTGAYYNELGGLTGQYYLVATDKSGGKTHSCVSTYASVRKVSVYPNPTADVVTIANGGWLAGDEVTLVDISGRVIETRVILADGEPLQFQLQDLPDGRYFVKFQNETVKVIRK